MREKKILGRKRFIAVDTLGMIWALVVLPAAVQDRVGGITLVDRLRDAVKYIQKLWSDSHFDWALNHAWVRWGWAGTVVRRVKMAAGFEVLPKRWIVERTFAWLGRNRRLAKDHERTIESSEGFIRLSMIRLMLKRIR